jgi:hypothetical protein
LDWRFGPLARACACTAAGFTSENFYPASRQAGALSGPVRSSSVGRRRRQLLVLFFVASVAVAVAFRFCLSSESCTRLDMWDAVSRKARLAASFDSGRGLAGEPLFHPRSLLGHQRDPSCISSNLVSHPLLPHHSLIRLPPRDPPALTLNACILISTALSRERGGHHHN